MDASAAPDLAPSSLSEAVTRYWRTLEDQRQKQIAGGRSDRGGRTAATGGAQMQGFIDYFAGILTEAGVGPPSVFTHRTLELPGFFRPTKEWDLLAIIDGRLLAAIEVKSQIGPSFGNNFNNRTEEAMGSALDIWTAYREGAFGGSPQPFLGYFFMLEDCKASQSSVRVREPHFNVFPEFIGASYIRRYELFCRKLVRERHYSAAAFITSRRETGARGEYQEPAPDLSVVAFSQALAAHVSAYAIADN